VRGGERAERDDVHELIGLTGMHNGVVELFRKASVSLRNSVSVNSNRKRNNAPFERLPCSRFLWLAIDNIENLDGAIGRTRRHALAVVVQLGIVNHVLVGGFDWDRVRSSCGGHDCKRVCRQRT